MAALGLPWYAALKIGPGQGAVGDHQIARQRDLAETHLGFHDVVLGRLSAERDRLGGVAFGSDSFFRELPEAELRVWIGLVGEDRNQLRCLAAPPAAQVAAAPR
jgi:hypothetical protein